MSRIQFFSVDDLSCGFMLEKLPSRIETFNEDNCFNDVNDAIEFYNISLFIRNDLRLLIWSEEYVKRLRKLEKPILKCVARFFSAIDDDNFNEILSQTDISYKADFLHLLCEFDIVKTISWVSIATAIENKLLFLWQLLKENKLVEFYSLDVRKLILSTSSSTELILSNLSDTTRTSPMFYFPKELSDTDVNCLFKEYLDSPDANLNYIQQITNYKNGSSTYKISKEVVYAARSRYEELAPNFFEFQQPMTIKFSVSFQQQEKIKSLHIDGLNYEYSYDSTWISNHLDFLEILYNFAFLFEWLDERFCITLISKPNLSAVLERLVGGRNKSDYFTNIGFKMINEVAIQQLKGYYHLLQHNGIQLEDVFSWYYTDYLEEEYGIKDFHISLPSKEASYYEKCKSIVPEFESLLKQYVTLYQFDVIDHRYIENVNPQISYTNIPSLCTDKYGYPKSDEIKNSIFLLFSSQSACYYLPEIGEENEDCLFSNIRKHKIKYSAFEPWQLKGIDHLVSSQILKKTTDEETLEINDINLVLILSDFYQQGFVSIRNYPAEVVLTLDELKKQDHVATGDTLLSTQEGEYFNYHLNDSSFGNSLSLRNKYSHGTPGDDNEREYFDLLKLLTLLTIKIDNDLQNSDRYWKT